MPGGGYERQNCTATSVPNAPSSAERREPASKRHADLSDLTRTGNTGPKLTFVSFAAKGSREPFVGGKTMSQSDQPDAWMTGVNGPKQKLGRRNFMTRNSLHAEVTKR